MNERVVLVTGGAGNLGQAVTRAFLQAGARVAIPLYKTDLPDALDALKQEYQERVFSFALDLTTERGAKAAVEQATEWGGQLSAVAHLVGGFVGGVRVGDTPAELWERMINLNLRSAWLIAGAALPQMVKQGGGSLVFVSSRRVWYERANVGAYAVSKAGLHTLAQAISEEYANEGVRANVVLPGTVDTPENRASMPGADFERWTSPDEIARVIMFLASPASGPINGAAIPVFGRS
jgi:NAD(P)-dependent dehydrogenase (short-subunit alcohol dehydrogenase family)